MKTKLLPRHFQWNGAQTPQRGRRGSPSPLNGERARVRGDDDKRRFFALDSRRPMPAAFSCSLKPLAGTTPHPPSLSSLRGKGSQAACRSHSLTRRKYHGTRKQTLIPGLLCAALLSSGCATYKRRSLDQAQAQQIEQAYPLRKPALTRETEDKILTLDPAHVTAKEIAEVLSQVPAPRIINIHGGIAPVHLRMISFSEFLIGLGYPRSSIPNPGDGPYTFSCYESSETIAGMIAWYYEHEGLRPIIVGHSQGGFQVVKVLHKLAGLCAQKPEAWNPLTRQPEKR